MPGPLRILDITEKKLLLAHHAETSEIIRSQAPYETKLAAMESFGQHLRAIYPDVTSSDISSALASMSQDSEPATEAWIRAHDFAALERMFEESHRLKFSNILMENHAYERLCTGLDSFLALLHNDDLSQTLLAEVGLLARPGDILCMLKSPHFNPESDPNDARALRLHTAHTAQFKALECMGSAAADGNLETLQASFAALLSACDANMDTAKSWVNRYKDIQGHTALHRLTESTAIESLVVITQHLIDWGIDLNAQNCHNQTVLHLATQRSNRALFTFLLCQPDLKLDLRDLDGRVALHYAASQSEGSWANLLLGRGADIHIKDDAGKTVLHAIIAHRKLDLLKQHAEDPSIRSYDTYEYCLLRLYLRLERYLENLSQPTLSDNFFSLFSTLTLEDKQATVQKIQALLRGENIVISTSMLAVLKEDDTLNEIMRSRIAKTVIDIDTIQAGQDIRLAIYTASASSSSSSSSMSSPP